MKTCPHEPSSDRPISLRSSIATMIPRTMTRQRVPITIDIKRMRLIQLSVRTRYETWRRCGDRPTYDAGFRYSCWHRQIRIECKAITSSIFVLQRETLQGYALSPSRYCHGRNKTIHTALSCFGCIPRILASFNEIQSFQFIYNLAESWQSNQFFIDSGSIRWLALRLVMYR